MLSLFTKSGSFFGKGNGKGNETERRETRFNSNREVGEKGAGSLTAVMNGAACTETLGNRAEKDGNRAACSAMFRNGAERAGREGSSAEVGETGKSRRGGRQALRHNRDGRERHPVRQDGWGERWVRRKGGDRHRRVCQVRHDARGGRRRRCPCCSSLRPASADSR